MRDHVSAQCVPDRCFCWCRTCHVDHHTVGHVYVRWPSDAAPCPGCESLGATGALEM